MRMPFERSLMLQHQRLRRRRSGLAKVFGAMFRSMTFKLGSCQCAAVLLNWKSVVRPLKKKFELLRAPKDNKEMAWPKGTQVMYHSVTGGGRWIEAHIEQFNPHNGTYNLDVRPEADADKVRPR
mmetsp:Transcript_63200/g.138388  ORF Transcript_63200/g.138388 Transcript_63200/m.138388 type:complete len:124 (+) Transcript_63200:1853-2224(+)